MTSRRRVKDIVARGIQFYIFATLYLSRGNGSHNIWHNMRGREWNRSVARIPYLGPGIAKQYVVGKDGYCTSLGFPLVLAEG